MKEDYEIEWVKLVKLARKVVKRTYYEVRKKYLTWIRLRKFLGSIYWSEKPFEWLAHIFRCPYDILVRAY